MPETKLSRAHPARLTPPSPSGLAGSATSCKGAAYAGFARAKAPHEWGAGRACEPEAVALPQVLLSPPPAYITIVNKQGRNRHAGNKIGVAHTPRG